MLKPTISKLYSFIAKLVLMLEEELDDLEHSKSRSAVNVKKNITETLNKLVTLIIQLNKLSKEESSNEKPGMLEEDKEIIARFLEKYKNRPLSKLAYGSERQGAYGAQEVEFGKRSN